MKKNHGFKRGRAMPTQKPSTREKPSRSATLIN